jgi:hypothetical protein
MSTWNLLDVDYTVLSKLVKMTISVVLENCNVLFETLAVQVKIPPNEHERLDSVPTKKTAMETIEKLLDIKVLRCLIHQTPTILPDLKILF